MPLILFNKLLVVLSKGKTQEAQKILNDLSSHHPAFYASELMKRPLALFMALQNAAFKAIEDIVPPACKENLFVMAELARIKKNMPYLITYLLQIVDLDEAMLNNINFMNYLISLITPLTQSLIKPYIQKMTQSTNITILQRIA